MRRTTSVSLVGILLVVELGVLFLGYCSWDCGRSLLSLHPSTLSQTFAANASPTPEWEYRADEVMVPPGAPASVAMGKSIINDTGVQDRQQMAVARGQMRTGFLIGAIGAGS